MQDRFLSLFLQTSFDWLTVPVQHSLEISSTSDSSLGLKGKASLPEAWPLNSVDRTFGACFFSVSLMSLVRQKDVVDNQMMDKNKNIMG